MVMSEEDRAPRDVPPEEVAAAFSGPAVLANKFYLTTMPAGARLAFCEQRQTSSLPEFRAAVIISVQDAVELMHLLNRMIGPIEEQIKAVLSAAEEQKNV
jgi:hypothetical protein